MLDETLENLKIKPLPKKPKENQFFIEKKEDAQLPTIIDKTGEKLINMQDFMTNIYNELGIINKDKIVPRKPAIDIEKTFDIPEEPTITIDPKKELNIITDIVKTSETIIIKPKNFKDDKLKELEDTEQLEELQKTEELLEPPSIEPIIKSEYSKKYKGIADDPDFDENKSLGDTTYKNRLPKAKQNIIIKASDYYLYNRETFINFINNLFLPYKEELLQEEKDIAEGKINISCDDSLKKDFSLLTHQNIVRDYINVFTPYRGVLLYHGLGSGKTCSSIAITEGIKNDKQVIVMTPASLRDNYVEELKKCGDYLYKKNQFWEFVDIKKYTDDLKSISNILKLPEQHIIKNGGAWFVNVQKKPNYETLRFEQQQQINEQINIMIKHKYEFISYNGLRNNHLISLTNNHTINPFSNKIVVIDEAHNFISRIVNKLGRNSSLSMKLYNYLMEAENCKIILLTGTPIINYPNEISILFNILRGSIKTYSCKFADGKHKTITKDYLEKIFKNENIFNHIDNLEYNSLKKELIVTKNPFGFVKTNKDKIQYSSDTLTSDEFKQKIQNVFSTNNIPIVSNVIQEDSYKALPDDFEQFKELFIDKKNNMKNTDMFKMRIVGLTSYFRSAQEQLMPLYDEDKIQIIHVPMSDFQFSVYEEARIQERKLEKNNKSKKYKNKLKKDEVYSDTVSTYRIFSRAFCNFVFPRPTIKRPMPNKDEDIQAVLNTVDKKENIAEDVLDVIKPQEKINDMDGIYEQDDIDDIRKEQSEVKDTSYQKRIEESLIQLETHSSKYLSEQGLLNYSPKFYALLKNIANNDNKGIHLLYSQFKTLEGIGIFKLVLKENGFAEFKLKKSNTGEYLLYIENENIGKPMFAAYTGSETPEEREIIKNVLNSNWKLVPSSIVNQLNTISENNYYGDVIKVLMITSSGAEGISLKNVRFVHIMEPYWHPVRPQQVIGRARRICSHNDLPKELQTVDVFLYLMKFTDKQIENMSIDIKLNDHSKKDKNRILTSDEFLYEISQIKEELNKELLTNVKQSSIDCSIHSRSSSKEIINCFSIGNPNNNKNIYTPNIAKQETDKLMQLNKKTIGIKLYKIKSTNYAINKEDNKIYDYDAYKKGDLVLIGKLETDTNGKNKIVKL
jgi:hypothetical protein